MQQSPHATMIPNKIPLCVVINVPASLSRNFRSSSSQNTTSISSERNTFIESIRECLSNGQAVLVKGWTPEVSYGFNIEDIGMIRPTITQHVQWQDNLFLVYYSYCLLTLIIQMLWPEHDYFIRQKMKNRSTHTKHPAYQNLF